MGHKLDKYDIAESTANMNNLEDLINAVGFMVRYAYDDVIDLYDCRFDFDELLNTIDELAEAQYQMGINDCCEEG